MSNLLNQTAVGRKDGEEAKELFGHYLQTRPGMALNHHDVLALSFRVMSEELTSDPGSQRASP